MPMTFGEAMLRRARNKDTELALEKERNLIDWVRLNKDYELSLGQLKNQADEIAAKKPQGLKLAATRPVSFSSLAPIDSYSPASNRTSTAPRVSTTPPASAQNTATSPGFIAGSLTNSALKSPSFLDIVNDQRNKPPYGLFLGGLIGKDKKPKDQPKFPQPEMLGAGKAREAAELLRPGARQRQIEEQLKAQGFRKGTSYVYDNPEGVTEVVDPTGNGHPTKDTVPAKLAEGEAVLNAGAMEIPGMRDFVGFMNEVGAERLGLRGAARTRDGVLHARFGKIFVEKLGKKAADWIKTAKANRGIPKEPSTEGYTVEDLNEKKLTFANWKKAMGESLAADAAKVKKAGEYIGKAVGDIAKVGGKVAPYVVIGGEALDTVKDIYDVPESERMDFALRRGEETAARLGAAYGLGKIGSVTGGLSSKKWVGPAAGLAGAVGGYFSPEVLGLYTTKDEAEAYRKAKEDAKKTQTLGNEIISPYTVGPTLTFEPQQAVPQQAAPQQTAPQQTTLQQAMLTPQQLAAERDAQIRTADEAAYSAFFNNRGITDEMRTNPEKHGLRRINTGPGSMIFRRGNEFIGMGAPSRIAAEEARANDPQVKRAEAMEELRQLGMEGNEQAAQMYMAMVQEDSYANTAAAKLAEEMFKANAANIVNDTTKGTDNLYKIIKDAADKVRFYTKDKENKSVEDPEKQARFNSFWGYGLAKLLDKALREGQASYEELMRDLNNPAMVAPWLENMKAQFELAERIGHKYGRRINSPITRIERIPDLTLVNTRGIFQGTEGRPPAIRALWDNVPFVEKGGYRIVTEMIPRPGEKPQEIEIIIPGDEESLLQGLTSQQIALIAELMAGNNR